MRISRARCYRYTLPLTSPLASGEQVLTDRRGILLGVESEDGAVGWGDAAPLPGFSAESGAEAASALRRVASALEGRVEGAMGPDDGSAVWNDAPPSVQFAVEGALLTARADAVGRSVQSVLGGGRAAVELNALITDDASVTAAVERLRAAGYRTLKLKVGRRAVTEDVRRVHALAEALEGEGQIRLDANRAWSMEEARAFAEALDPIPLAYIEEPLADPTRLSTFVEETELPVALDETTREGAPDVLATLPSIAAVVLKPTLLGGLSAVQDWVDAAHEHGATPVISASYESGVGVRLLAALASTLPDTPVGLSTYDRLDADVLFPRLSVGGPTVPVAPMFESTVTSERLVPLDDSDAAASA